MILIVILAIFGACLAALFSAVYLADALTGSRRVRVQGTPAQLGLRYEEIQFLTADRQTLRGWFMESAPSRGTVILLHELGETRADRDRRLLSLQYDYVDAGLSVFAFDFRGHGESGGRRHTFGRQERLDVQAAVAFVRRRMGNAPVILHGFGFGAAVALDAAARRVEVDAVICDSTFVDARAYLRRDCRRAPRLVFTAALDFARRIFGADVETLKPIHAVPQAGVPVFFIHNQDDSETPSADTLNLAASSLDRRVRVWVAEGVAGHAMGYVAAPEEYVRRCLDFMDDIVPARNLVAVQARAV
jgi:uncharacterized protein